MIRLVSRFAMHMKTQEIVRSLGVSGLYGRCRDKRTTCPCAESTAHSPTHAEIGTPQRLTTPRRLQQ